MGKGIRDIGNRLYIKRRAITHTKLTVSHCKLMDYAEPY